MVHFVFMMHSPWVSARGVLSVANVPSTFRFVLFVCSCGRERASGLGHSPSPSSASRRVPDVYTRFDMTSRHESESDTAPVRQIKNNSASASPPQPVAAATNTGHHDSSQTSPEVPQVQPTDFVVDLVSELLAQRPDAAEILTAVAKRVAPVLVPNNGLTEPGVQPGASQTNENAPWLAGTVASQHAFAEWRVWAAERRRLQSIARSIRRMSPVKPAELPGMQSAAVKFTSPPTVKILGERSREERDAELRCKALSLSPTLPRDGQVGASTEEWVPVRGGLAPQLTARRTDDHHVTHSRDNHLTISGLSQKKDDSSLSSIDSGSSLSLLTPTVRQGDASSPGLFTTTTVPDALKTSPSHAVIGQVLRAPLDFTTKDWRVRNFYDQSAVTAYARWSQPESQPHRDAPDALAELSDPDVLAVPAILRHSNPEIAADAWDQYRRHFIHSLHRAFAAGVDWLRALRAMSLVYSDPTDGHPRINQYIESAMTDRALVVYPLLHADVLLFKLDTSFASGSKLYSKDSRSADWERTTSRLPGEDVITLATRITEAYVKKVSDTEVNTVTVWSTSIYANQIYERFVECLNNDPFGPRERGPDTCQRYMVVWNKAQQKIARGQLDCSALNIIEISLSELEPHESSMIPFFATDVDDIPDKGTGALPSRRYTTTGRGARARRAERRLVLEGPPPQ